jgi:hypothetical protein
MIHPQQLFRGAVWGLQGVSPKIATWSSHTNILGYHGPLDAPDHIPAGSVRAFQGLTHPQERIVMREGYR